jgi:hypothetical protein
METAASKPEMMAGVKVQNRTPNTASIYNFHFHFHFPNKCTFNSNEIAFTYPEMTTKENDL